MNLIAKLPLHSMSIINNQPFSSNYEDEAQGHRAKRCRIKQENLNNQCLKRQKVEDDGSMSALRFINKDLNLSSSEVDRLRRERMQSLMREKKLILLLDLDHTLIHSTKVSDMSAEEKLYFDLVENDPNTSMFTYFGLVIKLRPFLHTFLKEASKMYDMYICTMGTHNYASHVAKLVDPQGIYFKSKVIAREDMTDPKEKSIDIVLGEERAVAIVDDTDSVWGKYLRNLILIEGYDFFGWGCCSVDDSDGRMLSKMEEDETESDGALTTTLNILKHVHRAFFGHTRSADFSNSDVRQLLREIGEGVRQGCAMDFGGGSFKVISNC